MSTYFWEPHQNLTVNFTKQTKNTDDQVLVRSILTKCYSCRDDMIFNQFEFPNGTNHLMKDERNRGR